jgi:hypothetical protein
MMDEAKQHEQVCVEEVLGRLQELFPEMELSLGQTEYEVLGQTIISTNVLYTYETQMGVVINPYLAAHDMDASVNYIAELIRNRWDPEKGVLHRLIDEFPMVVGYAGLFHAGAVAPVDLVVAKQMALIQVMDNWRCGMLDAHDAIEAYAKAFDPSSTT